MCSRDWLEVGKLNTDWYKRSNYAHIVQKAFGILFLNYVWNVRSTPHKKERRTQRETQYRVFDKLI
jgi:hypothetical protein